MGVFARVMKYSAVVLLTFVCLCVFTQGSIPSRQALRLNDEDASHLYYQEVTANHLAHNSVEREDIQDFSVDTQALLNRMVTNAKMADLSVNSAQVAPGAVTTAGASIDLVELVIKNDDTIPSASQAGAVVIPQNQESVQPWEAIRDDVVRVDEPDPRTSYRVEGKARGPGVILGWYPSQNGHLLRYQSSRALRGIVCAAIDVADINRRDECTCQVVVFDDDGFGFFDDDNLAASCNCDIDITFIDVNFRSTIADCGGCTVLDCDGDNADDNDPMCNNQSEDQRMNPFDDDDNTPIGDHLPDRCNPYTSVEDVNNPQEGVPVYSPSVESIQIDDTGRVEMRFFGRGTVTGAHDDIVVTVVVLLDDQYGA